VRARMRASQRRIAAPGNAMRTGRCWGWRSTRTASALARGYRAKPADRGPIGRGIALVKMGTGSRTTDWNPARAALDSLAQPPHHMLACAKCCTAAGLRDSLTLKQKSRFAMGSGCFADDPRALAHPPLR